MFGLCGDDLSDTIVLEVTVMPRPRHLTVRRRFVVLLPVALALVLGGAGPALADVTLGSATGTELCSPGYVAADTGLVIPAGGGTLTSFSYGTSAGTGGQQLDFEVLRPVGRGRYTVVGRTGLKTLPAGAGIVSFAAEIATQGGDVLGYYEQGLDNCLRYGATLAGVPSRLVAGDPATGATLSLGSDIQGAGLNLAATLRTNRPPATPAAPVADRAISGDGGHRLSWAATTDPDAGDAVASYRLQHRRADQSLFTPFAALASLAYRFGTDGTAETEGTWTYRLTAIDTYGAGSESSPSSAPVTVDMSAPYPPVGATEPPAPVFADAGTPWFRDGVRVRFAEAGDRRLVDGSAGSGVASVTDATTVEPSAADPGTGAFAVSGTATDGAGNVSAATRVSGRLDWRAPVAAFVDCPAAPVPLNGGGVVTWTAADPAPAAGLTTAASGAVVLGTATVGPHAITSPPPGDAVGHVGEAAGCRYDVHYAVSHFLAPVRNPPAVNTGAAGRVYPLRLELRDATGLAVSPLGAVEAVTYKATDCVAFTTDPAGGVPAVGAGGAHRSPGGAGGPVLAWETPATPGCYALFAALDSGQVLTASFRLTRGVT